jgi:hypothetical protein
VERKLQKRPECTAAKIKKIQYENKVSAYFDPKIRLANEVLESIKTTGAKIQELVVS